MKTIVAVTCLTVCFALPPAIAGTATVAALDSSGSVSADRTDICAASVAKITSSLGPDDTLAIVSIDAVPFGRKRPFFVRTLSPKSDSPLHVKLARNQFDAAVRGAMADWLATSAKNTRVADTMVWAADYLATNPAATKKLFVCSDGVEESPVLDMSARVPANALKRLEAGGFVPSDGLAGVEVSWVGLGGRKEVAHVRAVKTFWESYFRAVHAKLVLIQRNGL